MSTWVNLEEDGDTVKCVPMPVVNILSLVAYLFNNHGVVIEEENLAKYWSHMRDFLPWGKTHPAILEGGRHIPLGLHGDEARYTSSGGLPQKVIAISLSLQLWRPLSTRNSRFLLFVLRESMSLGKRSLFPIWRYIAWALNILFTGLKPQRGYLGMRLPSQVRAPDASTASESDRYLCHNRTKFALTELRGDWSWFYYSLCLSPHWVSACPCFKCDVRGQGSGNVTLQESYLDFSPSAAWCGNLTSHIEFLNKKLRAGSICTLVGLSGT